MKYIHTFKNSIKTVKGLDCAQPTLDTPLDDNGHKEPVKEKFSNNIDMKVILPFHGSDSHYSWLRTKKYKMHNSIIIIICTQCETAKGHRLCNIALINSHEANQGMYIDA